MKIAPLLTVKLLVVPLLLYLSSSGTYALRPRTYRKGDNVKLWVNKLTSTQTLFPLSYYHVPHCQPAAGIQATRQNLGQHVTGDEIRTSPYQLEFGRDYYCEHVCVANLGRSERKRKPLDAQNHMIQAIRRGFDNNWLLGDGLPAAFQHQKDKWIVTKYAGGFPLGYVDPKDDKAYIYNHINLEIHYHPVHAHDGDDADLQKSVNDHEEYRIVRFVVQPLSIKHKYSDWGKADLDAGADIQEGAALPKLVRQILPTASCAPGATRHTDYAQLYEVEHTPAQLASGPVLFTYDVLWVENLELHWGDRWDIYLDADGRHSEENHIFSTIVSLVLLALLSSMIVTLLSNNLQRDFKRYNKVATEEEKEEALEEYGWKLVHADVFRPPKWPLALAVLAGTGAQLLVMTLVCNTMGVVGIIQPMHRGKMVMAYLLVYALLGTLNGYVTGYFYRMFGGTAWRPAGLAAALGYSGLAFTVFFIASCMANSLESTMRAPFWVLLTVLVLWLGIAAPLTYFGTWVGFYRPQIEFPTRTSPTPRAIPDAPWYTSTPLTLVIAGIFPFVPCFFEVYDTLCVLWLDAWDPFYSFFFFIGLCALLLATEITILLTYFQLVREDYHWWWRSFANAGSSAIYIFLYVVYYHAQHLNAANHLPSWLLYYGYMLVACIGLACGAGFTGLVSALVFCRAIFGSVKID